MEENVHFIALAYRWPPGSWDNLTIARASRLWDAIVKRNEAMRRQQQGPDEEDLEA